MTKRSSITNLWLEFYLIRKDGISVCGICNNTGWIKNENMVACCICPNGRVFKTRFCHKPKWGDIDGSSIISEK